MTTESQQRWHRVKSAHRTLDILEYFGDVQRPLRSIEIATAFGLHPSSAAQLLKTMVSAGYFIFDPIKKLYHPSPRLTRFATWLTSVCFWNGNASHVLEKIRRDTHAYVALSVRSGNAMMIVDFAKPDSKIRKGVGICTPFNSNTGQAFLASCEEREVRRIIDRASAYKLIPTGSSKSLMERVHAVRSRGHAAGESLEAFPAFPLDVDNDFLRMTWTIAIAIPLHHLAPNKTVVLSVTGSKTKMQAHESKIVEIMQQNSRALFASM